MPDGEDLSYVRVVYKRSPLQSL